MKNAIGSVSYDVKVQCPHCNTVLRLNSPPYTYNEEFSIGDGIDLLAGEVMGTPTTPAAWKDFELKYKCYGCQKHFLLTELEI